jgi:DNA-binding response OmpR family regulator
VPEVRVRVVVADDDGVALRILAHSARSHPGAEVIAVADGAAALAACQAATPPDVVVLDWEMPGLTGPEVCRRVRALQLAQAPYLLVVTVRSGRHDVIAALNAGADDVLLKPVAPDLLRARLRLAALRRRQAEAPSQVIARALLEAREQGDGELLIRDRELAARVYFCRHKVGWAQLSNESGSLVDLISPVSPLDPETAQAVLEECHSRGLRLTDVLVEWGLLDRTQLRSCLKLWIARKLGLLLGLNAPTTLFMPGGPQHAEDLSFELSELLEPAQLSLEPSSSPPPSSVSERGARAWSDAFVLAEEPPAEVQASLLRCARIRGFHAAAQVDPSTGLCLGHTGGELQPDVAWSMIQNLSIVSRQEPTESCLVTTQEHFHIICRAHRGQSLVYAVFHRAQTSLASAWLELRSIVSPG